MSGFRLARPGRRFAILSAAGLALFLAVLVAAGWYYASLIHSGALQPDYSPDELNLRVVSVKSDRVVLAERAGENVDALEDAERWGLEGESGYGQVGAVLAVDGDEITREFRLLSGSITEGDYARLDSFAFQGDPLSARGLNFRSVLMRSPLGDFPAWEVDGRADTWVIFVHGWRSDREEALRILPTVSSLGLRSLVITYRNDEGAPRSDDGLIRWGATEWQDLEAAVAYAESQGARSAILFGYSMGGGIVMSFLQRSERAGFVSAVVLDAPVLDFRTLAEFQGGRRQIPGIIVRIARQFATWRFDVDWDAMDHLSHLERVHVPILLFHGGDDDLAPIESSRRLARERSDIVTFVVVEGAGHVRSWNVDPEAYERTVRQFLSANIQSRVPVP